MKTSGSGAQENGVRVGTTSARASPPRTEPDPSPPIGQVPSAPSVGCPANSAVRDAGPDRRPGTALRPPSLVDATVPMPPPSRPRFERAARARAEEAHEDRGAAPS